MNLKMKTSTKIAILTSCVLTLPLHLFAATDEPAADETITPLSTKANSILFTKLYSTYAQRFRVIGILRACDKAGIAKLLVMNPDEQAEMLLDYYLEVDKASLIGEQYNANSVMHGIQATLHKGSMYTLGYQDAMSYAIRTNQDICDTGIKLANDLLK